MNVKYELSLWPNTESFAFHYCNPKPRIRLYLPKISEFIQKRIKRNGEFFESLVEDIIYLNLLERVCLACRLNNKERKKRGLGKIRIHGRCQKYNEFSCKMEYRTNIIYEFLRFDISSLSSSDFNKDEDTHKKIYNSSYKP